MRYADDTTLIAKSLEKMTEMLSKLIKESAKLGLKLNLNNTNIMVIGQDMNETLNTFRHLTTWDLESAQR